MSTPFEQQRLTFAVKRLGIETPEQFETWVNDPVHVPPDERERRRAEVLEACPHLRPVKSDN